MFSFSDLCISGRTIQVQAIPTNRRFAKIEKKLHIKINRHCSVSRLSICIETTHFDWLNKTRTLLDLSQEERCGVSEELIIIFVSEILMRTKDTFEATICTYFRYSGTYSNMQP